MGLWIERARELSPLAELLKAEAELVRHVEASGATEDQKEQVVFNAVAVSTMVKNQLELYELGLQKNDATHGMTRADGAEGEARA